MTAHVRARILGTGSYVPDERLTNADLERMLDTSDKWIYSHTGIRERRIAEDDCTTSDMAVEAIRQALDMSECLPEDVDMIIAGTSTPDYRMPSTACVIQEKLNFSNAGSFDVVSACTGFLNGLVIAGSLIESGACKTIVVVGAEKLSSVTNYKDRNTCILFGDGAGAVVMAADNDGHGVLSSFIKSDGTKRNLLWIPVGGVANPYTPDFSNDGSDKLIMNGRDLYRIAVREMYNASVIVVKEAGISPQDISLIIPHQANIRIIEGLIKRLDVKMNRVFVNIDKYGNTSAASIPIALDEANRTGRLKPGDLVLMVAFGSGLVWGASVVRW
ncbi:3-oxoacyl-(acyl-carrier-protein) synthase 3 [Candidatus Zixiibacteriota bacterium]|nr:3-oxoacyl-(acyl-carrier-protein) synthase 3 [candidate division Zixibacteria bacterium]